MAMHLPYPKIKQFRDIAREIQNRTRAAGAPLPKLVFRGTVKLHGTNAAVARDVTSGETWVQSRNNVITVDQDNAGFAAFVAQPAEAAVFDRMFDAIDALRQPGETKAAIYGEWCGQGIQQKVAIAELPRRFVVFGVCLFDGEATRWLGATAMKGVVDAGRNPEAQVYCSEDFQTWSLTIDWAMPQLVQNDLGDITRAVETQCPVGKSFGVSGVGEGVVWQCSIDDAQDLPFRVDDLLFKVKGEEHSETKVTTLASVDVEKVQGIHAFVEKVVTEHRLEKKLETLVEKGFAIEAKSMDAFLGIVGRDVIDEESILMDENGLDRKAVMQHVNTRARQWFMAKLATV